MELGGPGGGFVNVSRWLCYIIAQVIFSYIINLWNTAPSYPSVAAVPATPPGVTPGHTSKLRWCDGSPQ